ncbi:MAG: hypothetical protein JHC32_01070 [Candidatus Aminicenantes bacterium]|nr:hypothetical protein [Candidatus Aminicenantes bacterium]
MVLTPEEAEDRAFISYNLVPGSNYPGLKSLLASSSPLTVTGCNLPLILSRTSLSFFPTALARLIIIFL